MTSESRGRPVLSIEHLTLELPGLERPLYPVRDISLTVAPGELHAIVGESGSGKSLTCRSVLRLGPARMRVASGRVQVEDVDVASLSGARLRRFRGARVGMIFQEPAAHLSPSVRVGVQIAETLRIHDQCSRRAANVKAHELAERVGLSPAKGVLRRYPHELSGGMAQRVAIAAAIICGPSLLIADEPTTALDATVQQSVLSLIDELRRDMKLGVLLVSHDLAVVERYADTVTVLYAGKVAEQASSDELFRRPRHPYTQALLRARPQLEDLDEVHEGYRPGGGSPTGGEESTAASEAGGAGATGSAGEPGSAGTTAPQGAAGSPGATGSAGATHAPVAAAASEPLIIPGAPPSLQNIPAGCPFHPRCPAAVDLCREVEPSLRRFAHSAHAACHVAADRAGLPPDNPGATGNPRAADNPRATGNPEARE